MPYVRKYLRGIWYFDRQRSQSTRLPRWTVETTAVLSIDTGLILCISTGRMYKSGADVPFKMLAVSIHLGRFGSVGDKYSVCHTPYDAPNEYSPYRSTVYSSRTQVGSDQGICHEVYGRFSPRSNVVGRSAVKRRVGPTDGQTGVGAL